MGRGDWEATGLIPGNLRGQYSDAVLSELESQNDDQVEGMSAKVKMLKDVSLRLRSDVPGLVTCYDEEELTFGGVKVLISVA